MKITTLNRYSRRSNQDAMIVPFSFPSVTRCASTIYKPISAEFVIPSSSLDSTMLQPLSPETGSPSSALDSSTNRMVEPYAPIGNADARRVGVWLYDETGYAQGATFRSPVPRIGSTSRTSSNLSIRL